MIKNLEYEDIDAGIWTAFLETIKKFGEKCTSRWSICEIVEDFAEENRTFFVPIWAEIDRNFGKIPPLRELVRTFSVEKLMFQRSENG